MLVMLASGFSELMLMMLAGLSSSPIALSRLMLMMLAWLDLYVIQALRLLLECSASADSGSGGAIVWSKVHVPVSQEGGAGTDRGIND